MVRYDVIAVVCCLDRKKGRSDVKTRVVSWGGLNRHDGTDLDDFLMLHERVDLATETIVFGLYAIYTGAVSVWFRRVVSLQTSSCRERRWRSSCSRWCSIT